VTHRDAYALLLVVAAALGGIGYLVSRDVIARRGHGLEALGKEFLPHVAQRIQNFHRVKMEKGRTVWEITAKEAQYFEQNDQIVVVEPHVTFYLKEQDRTAHLVGAEGRIMLDGHDVKMITLRGAVGIQMDDLHLATEEAKAGAEPRPELAFTDVWSDGGWDWRN